MPSFIIKYLVMGLVLAGLAGWAYVERAGRLQAKAEAATYRVQLDHAVEVNAENQAALARLTAARDAADKAIHDRDKLVRKITADLTAIREEAAHAPRDSACPMDPLFLALDRLRQRPAAADHGNEGRARPNP